MSLRLKEEYKVQFDAVDFKGKITINGLCSYMQIIAANHASLLNVNYYKNSEGPQYYWILSKVKYVIDEYPRWEERVTLETYPGGYEKLYAVRLFDIYNEAGRKIGHIIGDYLLMDPDKKRPVKIKGGGEALSFLDFPYEGECLTKLKIPEGVLKVEKRKAYYSEMDLNEHMNNGHYIKWVVDMLPLEILRTHEISNFEINYNTSVTYGTEVKVVLTQNEEGAYVIYGNSIDDTINYFVATVVLRAV